MSRDAAEPAQDVSPRSHPGVLPRLPAARRDGADRSLDFSRFPSAGRARHVPRGARELASSRAISTLNGREGHGAGPRGCRQVMRKNEVTAWLKRWGRRGAAPGDPVLLSFVLLAEGNPRVRLATAAVAGSPVMTSCGWTTHLGLRGSRARRILPGRPEPLAWGLSMFMTDERTGRLTSGPAWSASARPASPRLTAVSSSAAWRPICAGRRVAETRRSPPRRTMEAQGNPAFFSSAVDLNVAGTLSSPSSK